MLATWGCTTFPKPTLSLDFLGATSLDSGITFSRGSQATLFDSTGTLVYAKHNLLLQSEDFATTWTVSNSSISTNSTTAPSGQSTADTLVENTANSEHYVQQQYTVGASAAFSLSVFVKAAGRTVVRLFAVGDRFGGTAQVFVYNLTAVTATSVNGTSTGSITSVGNGWFRCVMNMPTTTTTGVLTLRIMPQDGANSTYTGNGTSGIFLWGAQLNLANMEGGVTSSLTTYYPTTTAAYYAPRFDYNPSTLQPRGLLIEEQRTNSIRNSTGVGAVAGTPGTLPTNWTTQLSGLTQTVVGAGTSSGISYIDIRLNGTTSANFFTVLFEPSNGIAASNSQTWSASSWIAVVGGSTANITSLALAANQYSSVPTYISTLLGTNRVSTITSSLTRISDALTTNSASTAFIQPLILFNCAVGAAIDITLRIGLPQLELGAFATSVIPTTTTALTRNADVASMTGTNFSSWYNASEGTLVTEATAYALKAVGGQYEATIGTAGNNEIRNRFVNALASAQIHQTAAGETFSYLVAATANTVYKTALAYKANDSQAAINGTASATDTSVTIPTGITAMYVGMDTASANQLCGHLRRIVYYPVRLAGSTLQALTA